MLKEIVDIVEQMHKKYGAYIKKVCAYKLKDMPDKVDDCVQDVFLTLFRTLSGGGEIRNYKSWLYSTARNLIGTVYKNEKSEREGIIKYSEENRGSFMLYFDENDLFKKSEEDIYIMKDQIVEKLTEEEQRLLNDRYVLKKSYEQIADEYGVDRNTAYQRVFRLNTKIRSMVKKTLEKDANSILRK